MGTNSLVLGFLRAGKLESAWDLMKQNNISSDELDYGSIFPELEEKIACQSRQGCVRSLNSLNRRVQSLKIFQKHGFVPQKLMVPVNLPDGYHGKVLLIRIFGGKAHGLVCLRGGDDWHREILNNTKEEIQDLGFENSSVVPAGGAWARFEADETVIIHGSSSEFGACDKKMAADLISGAFPGKKMIVRQR